LGREAGARGFYITLLERVFHIKKFTFPAVISFSFFVIAYRFYNTLKDNPIDSQDLLKLQ
jgi:hypothetical protein